MSLHPNVPWLALALSIAGVAAIGACGLQTTGLEPGAEGSDGEGGTADGTTATTTGAGGAPSGVGGASTGTMSTGGTGGVGGHASGGSGGAPWLPPSCAPGTTAEVYDDFETDLAQWTVYGAANGGAVAVLGGELQIDTAPNLISTTGVSVGMRSLRDCEISAELVQGLNKPVEGSAALYFRYSSTNFIAMGAYNDLLLMQIWDGTINDTEVPLTPAHRFWRIRHAGTEVHFETSPDGSNFTVLRTDPEPWFVDGGTLGVGAGTWQAEANPGTAHFDNFNLLPR